MSPEDKMPAGYESAEILFKYCLSTSRVLTKEITDITGGNIIESIMFTTSVVLKRLQMMRPDIYTSMCEHMLIMIGAKAQHHNVAFGSVTTFDYFIQRRFKWYWREYNSLKVDDDLFYPSVAAYSFYFLPFTEDRICCNPDAISLLRERIAQLDKLIGENLYKITPYL